MAVKFIVDNNVGKLAPWLRALGHDTVFINPIDDDDLIEIARRDGRVALTRDTGILRRRVITSGEVPALYIKSDNWRAQLAQVIDHFGLTTRPDLIRCLACNAKLEPRTPDEARARVPAYVHRTQPAFRYCPACDRYYWHGTHTGRIRAELEGLPRPA